MDSKRVAKALIRIARELVARDVYDLQSMGGGVSDVFVTSMMRDEGVEAQIGMYSGGTKPKWEKAVADFNWEDRETMDKERQAIEAELKKLMVKFDKDVAAMMKKLGYKK